MIGTLVVSFLDDDLGREVQRSTAECAENIVIGWSELGDCGNKNHERHVLCFVLHDLGKAEINNGRVSFAVEENVLGLQITV